MCYFEQLFIWVIAKYIWELQNTLIYSIIK